jgi:hypothetical protein
VVAVTVVGDAMARPLLAAIEEGIADVSPLAVVANGGAVLTPYVKERLVEALPNAMGRGRRGIVGDWRPDESPFDDRGGVDGHVQRRTGYLRRR